MVKLKYTLNQVREMFPNKNIVEYKGTKKVIVNTEYGLIKTTISDLGKSYESTEKAALNKTEFFKNRLKEKWPDYESKFKVLLYEHNSRVYIQTWEGVCRVNSITLMDGSFIKLNSYLNLQEVFKNKLLKNFPNYWRYYKVLEYVNTNCTYVQDNYGICKTYSHRLLKKALPDIKSAINKNSYYCNKISKLNKGKYNLREVIYKSTKTNLILICKKHGEFTTKPIQITGNKEHCSLCRENIWKKENWVKVCGDINPYIYLLHFKSKLEEFYKIGITKDLESRFRKLRALDYKIDIVDTVSMSPSDIWDNEKRLLLKYKNFKHVPIIRFGGYTECISKNIINEYKLLNNDY